MDARLILDGYLHPILVIGEDQRIAWGNAAARRWLQRVAPDTPIRQAPLSLLFPEADPAGAVPPVSRMMADCARNAFVESLVGVRWDSDTEPQPMEISLTGVPSGGRRTGSGRYLIIFKPLHLLIKAIQEMNAVTMELREKGQMLKTRNLDLELTQRHMIQNEKMALLGRLAGSIAQEINNPLGIIIGYAQALLRRISDQHPLHRFLDPIEREAQRCRQITENLMIFSRPANLGRSRIRVDTLLAGVRDLIEPACRERGVELATDCPPGLPALHTNPVQLQQVLLNLIQNALDALPAGGQVRVAAWTTQLDGRDHLTLLVEDNGTGILPEHLPHVFEPFFTTKDPGRGTGLGLSIVHSLVQSLGGEVTVDSKWGEGTRFHLTFPLAG